MKQELRIKNNPLKSIIHCNKGQVLIEVLASFGVAVVIITAITIAILVGLSNTQSSKSRNLASQYAQQGIEIMRQKRDSGIIFTDGTFCLVKDSISLVAKGAGCSKNEDLDNNFSFFREVTVNLADSAKCSLTNKITVTVFWADSKCPSTDVYCNNVQLISCLTDFVPVAAP